MRSLKSIPIHGFVPVGFRTSRYRHLDVEKRSVLLSTEHIALSHIPAGQGPSNRYLECSRSVEGNEMNNRVFRDTVEPSDYVRRKYACPLHKFVSILIIKHNVKSKQEISGILAADFLRD